MSLDTYSNLIKEVSDWAHRSDLDLKIPSFISLAENAMYSNDAVNLQVREMAVTSTATTSTRYLALPDRFESGRGFRIDTEYGELQYKSPEQMNRHSYTGQPNFFTISGDQIEFDTIPVDGYTVEFNYYRKAEPLSTSNETNLILTNHPQVYLYGALAQAYTYINDTEQQAIYFQLFIAAIKGANKADKKGRYGPSPAMSLESCPA